LLLLTSTVSAQTNINQTINAFNTAIASISLGTPQYQFFESKPKLKNTNLATLDWRYEITESIQESGVKSFTYYFTKSETSLLYEIIVELENAQLCTEMAEKLLGKPNYPDKPNHWIAGAAEGVITLAWTFDKKFVLAANLPESEWDRESLFSIPPGFESSKHLPNMSEWPGEELHRFFVSIEELVKLGASNFEAIKGAETDGYFFCTKPLAGAENAAIFQDDKGKWIVSNTFVSGANPENAILWKMDAEQVIGNGVLQELKLTRTKARSDFGALVELWDIHDKSGKPTGLQLGILQYEWGANGLWNVDILVLQQ
jgi:hypothetical protein